MFNCKKLFKLQIKPPSLILLITTPQDRCYFPANLRSEKFDDDDDNDDVNNNNDNNKGPRDMGDIVPLYGVDSALVLTNPGVQ